MEPISEKLQKQQQQEDQIAAAKHFCTQITSQSTVLGGDSAIYFELTQTIPPSCPAVLLSADVADPIRALAAKFGNLSQTQQGDGVSLAIGDRQVAIVIKTPADALAKISTKKSIQTVTIPFMLLALHQRIQSRKLLLKPQAAQEIIATI